MGPRTPACLPPVALSHLPSGARHPGDGDDNLAAWLTTIDGYAGATWSMDGTLKVAFAFTLEDDDFVEIELLED